EWLERRNHCCVQRRDALFFVVERNADRQFRACCHGCSLKLVLDQRRALPAKPVPAIGVPQHRSVSAGSGTLLAQATPHGRGARCAPSARLKRQQRSIRRRNSVMLKRVLGGLAALTLLTSAVAAIAATPAPPAGATPEAYTVKPGDVLSISV